MTDPALRPIIHVDRPLLDADLAYVGDRATLVAHSDAELVGVASTVIGVGHRWDADRFARFPDLRIVSRMGIGCDNIDLDAARAAGVVVCNGPDSPTVSTAEHAVALMMAITKELSVQQDRSARGLGGPAVATALELDGSTLGLVGLGRIGGRVARSAQGRGMDVVAHDPGLTVSPLEDVVLVTLDELYERSHVISLHAPAIAATRHMICSDTIDRMRHGVYIVNCARGPLVDHEALLAAIDDGRVAGAGLDVTDPEPLPSGHPLLARSNVVVTPHVASSTAVGRRRLFEHAIENVLAVLEGRPASIVT